MTLLLGVVHTPIIPAGGSSKSSRLGSTTQWVLRPAKPTEDPVFRKEREKVRRKEKEKMWLWGPCLWYFNEMRDQYQRKAINQKNLPGPLISIKLKTIFYCWSFLLESHECLVISIQWFIQREIGIEYCHTLLPLTWSVTTSYVAQASLELTIQLRMTLNARIVSVCHHTRDPRLLTW